MRYMGMALAVLMMNGAWAADDVFMQAVGFAVSGSDAGKVASIDRQQCVFKVNKDNTDRVTVQGKKNRYGSVWAEVELHGKSKLAEIYSAPPEDRGTELDRQMRAADSRFFEPHTDSYADYTLVVQTNEQDRLIRAWQYIYANGCKGLKSPF